MPDPAGRRIIRIDESGMSVALETGFDSEERLHTAVAMHPEVLPYDDFGLGPLIPLASELGVASGSIDLLAADPQGNLVIIEFKKGSENPDVRKVVAQLLDYGAGLWRMEYGRLEQLCLEQPSQLDGSLVGYAEDRLGALGQAFDEAAFRAGVERSLQSGNFSFVFCARDLDERTRRIMTYLAEGARMRVFAVEVECYREGVEQGFILVPRTAFVPSWIADADGEEGRHRTAREVLNDASPEFRQLIQLMDAMAQTHLLRKIPRSTGWQYLPKEPEEDMRWPGSGIGVYASSRGMEINLSALRDLGKGDIADDILGLLERIAGRSLRRSLDWPAVACAAVIQHWEEIRAPVVERYFRARHEGRAVTSGV